MDTQSFQRERVMTVLAVAKGLVLPNFVYRDARSGAWIALPSRQRAKELMATSWEHLLHEDQGLLELRQLEPGQAAERPDPSGRWRVIEAASQSTGRARREGASEAERYEQELRVAGHADVLMAYLVLLGVATLVIAGFAFMLHGRIPQPVELPLALKAQVHSAWWPLIAVGVWCVVWGIVAGSRRAAWAGLLGALAVAGLGVWGWELLGRVWLPAPVGAIGLGAVIGYRSLALACSRWRLGRIERRMG